MIDADNARPGDERSRIGFVETHFPDTTTRAGASKTSVILLQDAPMCLCVRQFKIDKGIDKQALGGRDKNRDEACGCQQVACQAC